MRMMVAWKTIWSEDVAKLHCCLSFTNQRQERPITDGLVDITAADEDAFNSFHFHIVAIHAAMDGRRKESSRRKRMLLVGSSWLAQAAVSSVGVTAKVLLPIWLTPTPTPITSSLSHNLIIIIHSSSDATLLQIILLYLSHNALSQTSQCSSPQPSWSVLSSSCCHCLHF